MSYTSSGVLSLLGQPEEQQSVPQPDSSGMLNQMLSILQLGRTSTPPGGSGPAAIGGSPNHWEDLARQMAARRGWTGADWNALDQIATAESGWNPRAVNPSSGAAGIPQMLPSAHPDINLNRFMSNPQQQIRWMLNYIQGRYGSPSHALQVRNQQGWY